MNWDRKITSYAGYAGEVVHSFIAPTVWLSILPVFFVWSAFTLIVVVFANFAPELLDSVMPILAYLICSTLVGRFALGAAQGDIKSGFLNPDVDIFGSLLFALRAAILLLIWELPLYGLTELFGENALAMGMMSLDFVSVIAFFLGFLMLLGFPLSWLLATASSEFSEIFSKNLWLYVFQLRRRDLPIFFSAVVGGGLLFFGLYCIPCLLLGKGVVSFVISLSVSDPMAATMLSAALGWMAVPIVPAMAAPILLGRLCGAFLQGAEALAEQQAAREPSPQMIHQEEFDDTDITEVQPVANSMQAQYLPEDEPSDELISCVKRAAGEYPEITTAYLLRHAAKGSSEVKPCVAVEIDSEAKLSRQQEVKKAFSDQVPHAVIFLNLHTRAEVMKVGTLIFRRK